MKKQYFKFYIFLIASFILQCNVNSEESLESSIEIITFSPATTINKTIQPIKVEENFVENIYYGDLIKYEYKKNIFNSIFLTDVKKKIEINSICYENCNDESLVLTNNNPINILIEGLEPNSVYEIWIFSEPKLLGKSTVNSDGKISIDIILSGVDEGIHTLQIKEEYTENNTVSIGVKVQNSIEVKECNFPNYQLNEKTGVHYIKSEKIIKNFIEDDNWSVLFCDGSSEYIKHGDAVEWLKLGREIIGLDLNNEKVYGFNLDIEQYVEEKEIQNIPACNYPNVGIDKVVKSKNNNFWFYQCDGKVIEVQPYSMSILNWGCSGQDIIGLEDFSKDHLLNDGVCDGFNSEIESTPICNSYRDVIGCGGQNNSGYTGNTLETTFNICDYDVNSTLCSENTTNSNIDDSECTRPYEGTGFMEDVLYIEGVYEYNDKSRGISNFNIAYCNITSDSNGENLRTEISYSGGALSNEAIEWAAAGRPIRGIDNFTELDIYKNYIKEYIPRGPQNGLCKDIKNKFAFSQQLPSDTVYAWAYVRPNCNSIYVDYGTLSDFIDSKYWIPVNTNLSLSSLDIKFFNPKDMSFQLKDNSVYQFGVEYDSSNPVKFIFELQQPILTTSEFLKLFESNLDSDQCKKDVIKNINEDGTTTEEKGPSCFSVNDDVDAVPYFCAAYPLDLSCIKLENYDDPEIKQYCSVNLESPFCLHKDNILNNYIDQICLSTNDPNCYTYDRSMFYDRDVYCKYNAGTDESCPPEAPPEGSFDWSPYEDSEGNLDREKLCNDYPESSECTGIETESGYDCTFYPEIPECQTNEEVQSEPSCPEGEVYDGTACNCPEGTQPDPENGGCMSIEYYPEDNSVDCNVDPGNPECPPITAPEDDVYSQYATEEEYCNANPEDSNCSS